RVGLGRLGDGLGEGADLPRVGDRNRQAGPGEGRSYNGLQATGGLEHDEVGLQNLETRHEVVEPGTSARHGKIFTTWTHGNIEAVLRYIVPTVILSMATRPCLSELAVRPARLFGFDGTAGRVPSLATVLEVLREDGHPPATAPRLLGESGKGKLQGKSAGVSR